MAEYLIQSETLDDIANAINAKTGGSSAMTPAEMVTEIAAIPSGGGSLPSVISKIDGGSFTLASDTATNNMPISHNLGVIPSGIAIWSEDIVAETYSVRSLAKLFGINGTCIEAQINTTGAIGVQQYTISTIETENFTVKINGMHYKAGATYKWLAWA